MSMTSSQKDERLTGAGAGVGDVGGAMVLVDSLMEGAEEGRRRLMIRCGRAVEQASKA